MADSKNKLSFFGKLKKNIKRFFLFLLLFHIVYLFYCKWFFPPITATQIGSLIKGQGLKKESIHFDKMGSNVKLAAISSEDQLFTDHNGFDLKAIKLAMKYNKKHPDRPRGASTISQQVAKNVFLWQSRNFIRKGLEVYFTFMIELIWGKKRILEIYLNIAEMGKGIYGIEAASQHYFKKSSNELSKNEAAQIISLLPNPILFTIQPISKHTKERTPEIIQQMNNLSQDEDIKELIK